MDFPVLASLASTTVHCDSKISFQQNRKEDFFVKQIISYVFHRLWLDFSFFDSSTWNEVGTSKTISALIMMCNIINQIHGICCKFYNDARNLAIYGHTVWYVLKCMDGNVITSKSILNGVVMIHLCSVR